MSWLPTRTEPPAIEQPGRVWPMRVRAMVVLPEPLSPMGDDLALGDVEADALDDLHGAAGVGAGFDAEVADLDDVSHQALLSRILMGRLSIKRFTLIVRLAMASDGISRCRGCRWAERRRERGADQPVAVEGGDAAAEAEDQRAVLAPVRPALGAGERDGGVEMGGRQRVEGRGLGRRGHRAPLVGGILADAGAQVLCRAGLTAQSRAVLPATRPQEMPRRAGEAAGRWDIAYVPRRHVPGVPGRAAAASSAGGRLAAARDLVVAFRNRLLRYKGDWLRFATGIGTADGREGGKPCQSFA